MKTLLLCLFAFTGIVLGVFRRSMILPIICGSIIGWLAATPDTKIDD